MQAPTQNSVPRSAYDRTGGIVYFARMLHKIRLHAAGVLRADYHANLGTGFDGRCCRFIGVEYSALRDRVLEGGTDDEILGWCFELGTRPEAAGGPRRIRRKQIDSAAPTALERVCWRYD